MSLINQMLKDLEKRRADGVGTADSPIQGVTRYTVTSKYSSSSTYLLGGIFLVTLGIAVFLGWDYWLKTQQEKTSVAMVATPPEKIEQPKKVQEETPEIKSNNPIITKKKPEKKTKPKAGVKNNRKAASPQTKQVKTAAALDEEEIDDAKQHIKKQRRPLSAEQQAELAYQKGYDLLAKGRIKSAEIELRRALKLSQNHIKAREMLAGVYIKAGRYVEAGDLLHTGMRLVPEHIIFTKLYARVLLEQDNVTKAVRVLEQRMPTHQADPDYHALLAALYQRQGEHFKAAARYRDILKVNPSTGIWWIGLGISLEKLGKHEEAVAVYQRARNTGTLAMNLVKYTDNRMAALKDIGYPPD